MARKPSYLQFGNNDIPPLSSLAALSVQHAAIVLINLVYVLIITKALKISGNAQIAVMAITLLSAGVGSIVQAIYGSRLLIIFHANPIYIPMIIAAGYSHGVAGITVLVVTAGLFEFVFGSVVSKLRALFPPEVCGVVVIMLGVTLLPNSLRGIVQGSADTAQYVIDGGALKIAVLTLATAAGCSVWLKGTPRFFSIFIACVMGLILAHLTGYWNNHPVQHSINYPLFSLPILQFPTFALDQGLIFIAAMGAILNVVGELGTLIGADRLDDADWRKPDFKKMSRGLQTGGTFTVVSGLLGGFALGMSVANLSLAYATGASSRMISVVAGALLVIVAFMPKILSLVTMMPDPVVAGVLFYTASYFIVSGADLSMSRMMSPRRAIVIGVSVGIGIILQSTPALQDAVKGSAYEHFFAPMTFATFIAIVLNVIMRINIAQKEIITVQNNDFGDVFVETLERLGETWGLHRKTITRASSSIRELAELFSVNSDGSMTCTIENNDHYLFITFHYSGNEICIPEKSPTADELLNDPRGVSLMSGWIIKSLSDRVHVTNKHGLQEIRIGFEC
jgi:xanthine permease XanP